MKFDLCRFHSPRPGTKLMDKFLMLGATHRVRDYKGGSKNLNLQPWCFEVIALKNWDDISTTFNIWTFKCAFVTLDESQICLSRRICWRNTDFRADVHTDKGHLGQGHTWEWVDGSLQPFHISSSHTLVFLRKRPASVLISNVMTVLQISDAVLPPTNTYLRETKSIFTWQNLSHFPLSDYSGGFGFSLDPQKFPS